MGAWQYDLHGYYFLCCQQLGVESELGSDLILDIDPSYGELSSRCGIDDEPHL